MKRFLTAITVLILAVSFTACRAEFVQETTNAAQQIETSETEETQSSSVTPKQRPMYAVSLPNTVETETAEDGTTVFLYRYQNISLVGPEPEASDKIIIDFLNHVDETSTVADSLRKQAIKNYAPGTEWTHPYTCDITFQPERIDSSVLSMFASCFTYADTPRPEVTYYSVNYDILTGNLLSLTDILTDSEALDTLYRILITNLDEKAEMHQLYDGFQETVENRLLKETDYDRSWHLSTEGLVFYFSPYEIAPYTSGVIYAVLPYDSLTGILKDAYFPAESDTDTGSVYIQAFDEEIARNFTQISEIVLETDAQNFLLYTDTSVSDVHLYCGTWMGGNDTIPATTADRDIFTSNSLTPGDAIMLQCNLADTLSPVVLTYSSNGKTYTGYLYYDKETNTTQILSLEEYAAAVT